MPKLVPFAAVMVTGLLLAACNGDSNNSNQTSSTSNTTNNTNTTPNTPELTTAKNVVFFLGDGMGITTLTAARIYSVGEEGSLTLDTLPESAFVKTFSNDSQVTDSAPSMSAYMTGVKSNNGVISMDAAATPLSDCSKSAGVAMPTLLELAKAKGMATGVVTTTRVTHATPAATYAHICNRDLENDIAVQAVPAGAGYNAKLADGLDLLLGGGRQQFLPKADAGSRTDSRNLIAEMKTQGYQYVATKDELAAASTSKKLVGLFNNSHMSYDLDRLNNKAPTEPSLSEMTAKALDILSKKDRGFFLMVEGGRIDHALHDTNAKRALQDTVAFDNAIKVALDKMQQLDPGLKHSLIVVTADHDHTLVLNGYAKRTGKTTATEAGVLGLVKNYAGSSAGQPSLDANGSPYSIIGFGNGSNRVEGARNVAAALTDAVTAADDYRQEVVFQVGGPGSETHGGTDVFLGAIGFGAEQFHGVIDNTHVFGQIKTAAGL